MHFLDPQYPVTQFWYPILVSLYRVTPMSYIVSHYYPISVAISGINRILAPITLYFVRCSFQGPTNTMIAMILIAIAVGITRWTQMICAIMRTNILPFI